MGHLRNESKFLFISGNIVGGREILFPDHLPLMWNILYLQSPVYVTRNSQGTHKNVILAFGVILFFVCLEKTLHGSLQLLNTQCTTDLVHILAMAQAAGGRALLLRHPEVPQTQTIAPGTEQSCLWFGKARCLCGERDGTLLTQGTSTLYVKATLPKRLQSSWEPCKCVIGEDPQDRTAAEAERSLPTYLCQCQPLECVESPTDVTQGAVLASRVWSAQWPGESTFGSFWESKRLAHRCGLIPG